MDLTLIMYRDDGAHRAFPIRKPETVIGRREDCDLRIAVGDVSRKHSKVSVDGDAARVEDLGSSNGTFVNGKRVNASPLAAGDVLKVGPVIFVVQVGGKPSEDSFAGIVARSGKSDAAPAKPKPVRTAASIDGEIDELSILNDSSQGSGINIDLNDSKT